MFETGTNRWRRFDTWPPADGKKVTFSFAADGGSATASPPAGEDGFDEYVSDPEKPVPYTEKTSPRMENDYMTADQRFAVAPAGRAGLPDAGADGGRHVAGPIEVELHVSTTGTDSDFVVKLIDVYPDDYPDPDPNPTGVRMGGYQQLVRGEPFRGKYRNSFAKPEPFEPGKPAAIKFAMPDVCHSLPQRPPDHGAGAEQLVPAVRPQPADVLRHLRVRRGRASSTATQRVYRSAAMPSGVTLRVVQP